MTLNLFSLIFSLILTAGAVYCLVSILLNQNNEADALSWLDGKEPEKSKFPLIHYSRPLVHNFTLSYVKKIKNKNYRNKLSKKILISGLAKELNVDEFLGLQILWGLAFPILFFILNLVFALQFPPITSLIMSLLGFYFPHAYCNSCRQKRLISIMSDLPVFLDILALCTEAGLDLVGAIQKITQKTSKDSVLSQEFSIVLKNIALGQTRAQAFLELASRNDIPELTSVLSVIRDSEETGASIAKNLKDKSEQMRFERFSKAEELGAKASQKLLIPMMIFIVPAIFIIALAPAALSFLGN